MRFTPQAIKALSLPPGKSEHWEWDPGLPCFGVRVRPGLKRYYVQYRWNGKSEKQSLGDPATVSVPQACEAAEHPCPGAARRGSATREACASGAPCPLT